MPSPALANRPVLSPQNVIYKEAFDILSPGRQNTDKVLNPISFISVMGYCDNIGEFDGYERLRYWYMVSACDLGFIPAMLQRSKLETEKLKNRLPLAKPR